MLNSTAMIARAAACALLIGLPALASAQSLYEDPRPKKQFPPTLTPPPAPARTKLAYDTASCVPSARLACAPQPVVAHVAAPGAR